MRYMQAVRSSFGACHGVGGQVDRLRREVPGRRVGAGWYGCPVAVVIAAAALLPTAAVAADPVTFSATGAAQTYTAPPGVTSITATVNGAAGGAFSPGSAPNVVGKNGGQTKATLLVAPGNVLTLVVGKAGSTLGAGTSAAYGGGGAAGGAGGAGGGGGSFVFGPTGFLLVAAGGGGGFGGVFGGGEGAGAGTVGLAGGPGVPTGRIGGAPGTETAGGVAGSSGGTAGGGPATIASFATTGGAGGGTSGGGGGGGYFGGGGGGTPDGIGGGGGQGGGGGSGYASPNTVLVTGASGSVGTQAGDGQITFVPNEGPVPPPPVAEQCANGIDDDHDGFTDAVDPQCKLNRGSEGPVDNPLIACTDNDLVLVNVTRVGGRVLASGIADRGFQGRKVEIFAGDTKAGAAVVADNGSFAARLPAPSARKARTIRYQARLDQRRSPALKLARHMSVTTARVSGTAVVLAGRVTGSRRKRAVVDLLGRTGGCNSHKFVVVGRARLRPDGSFRVTAKPFSDLAIAIYRARTTIPGGRTFTLPQAVKLR